MGEDRRDNRGPLYWVGMILFALVVVVFVRLAVPTATQSQSENVTSPSERRISQSLINTLIENHVRGCMPAIQQQAQDASLSMSAAQVSQYCECVAERYYSVITNSEFDNYIAEGRLPPRIEAIQPEIQNECTQSIASREQPVRGAVNGPNASGQDDTGTSAYVRLSPREWLTLEIPRNWLIHTDTMTQTVAALMEARGADPTEALASFSAWLPSPVSGESIARMNIRFYPNPDLPSNEELVGISAADFAEFDEFLEQEIRGGVERFDAEITEWHGSELVQIKQNLFIVSNYERDLTSNPLGDASKVYLHRYWGSEQSFTLTTACEVDACPLVEPILQHIQTSLRIE